MLNLLRSLLLGSFVFFAFLAVGFLAAGFLAVGFLDLGGMICNRLTRPRKLFLFGFFEIFSASASCPKILDGSIFFGEVLEKKKVAAPECAPLLNLGSARAAGHRGDPGPLARGAVDHVPEGNGETPVLAMLGFPPLPELPT